MTKRPIVPPASLVPVLMNPDAALVVSISGGKDSQGMFEALATAHAKQGWLCGLYAVHADLGRMEWAESLPHCQAQADRLGVYLKVVRRPQGDLLQEMQDRMHKLAGDNRSPWPSATQRYCTADQKRDQVNAAKRKPHWPSAEARYCTADQKRGQIAKAMRAPHWPSSAARYCTAHQKTNQIATELRAYSLVVSAIGIRAQESRARAKRVALEIDNTLSGKRFRDRPLDECLAQWQQEQTTLPATQQARLAITWHPILDWSVDDVWASMGTTAAELASRQRLYKLGETADKLGGTKGASWRERALAGWPAHPAYVYGNERVSCALCVLAGKNDLQVGAKHNPELVAELIRMEDESGFTFKHGYSLREALPEGTVVDPVGA